MSSLFFSFIDIIIGGFVIYALFNEGKAARFERKLFAKFHRKNFKVIKGKKSNRTCA